MSGGGRIDFGHARQCATRGIGKGIEERAPVGALLSGSDCRTRGNALYNVTGQGLDGVSDQPAASYPPSQAQCPQCPLDKRKGPPGQAQSVRSALIRASKGSESWHKR